MIEIELFYKTVEAKIRAEHCEYLEREKRAVVPVILPVVEELPTGEAWKKLGFFGRRRFKKRRKQQLKDYKKALKKKREMRVEDKLLKGYNSGVKMALRFLKQEYRRFNARIRKEERQGFGS